MIEVKLNLIVTHDFTSMAYKEIFGLAMEATEYVADVLVNRKLADADRFYYQGQYDALKTVLNFIVEHDQAKDTEKDDN